jgi:hypothetical protein
MADGRKNSVQESIWQRNKMIHSHHGATRERDARAENFAAELTNAVYPLLLRRGLKGSWLKTELIVWKRLGRTIKRWSRERPHMTTPCELDSLRERLFLGDSDGLSVVATADE